MADAHDTRSEALLDLAHFELRMSASGRLLHYAQDRIRTFWLRQTLTFFAAATIALLSSMRLGLLLAALAIAGEAADVTCLTRVIKTLRSAQDRSWQRRAALITAGVQASTIAAAVTLCWRTVPLPEARFFASAFLISAMINAGLDRPHLRAAADVRLAIFALTGFLMMALDLTNAERATSPAYGYFTAGFGLLVYISILFTETVERNHLQRCRYGQAQLRRQQVHLLAQTELSRVAMDSQRLAFVAKYAKDSIIVSGPDGRIEWVNDAFSRITGYPFEEAIGWLPGDLLNAPGTEPDTVLRLIKARETKTPVRAEVLNRAKSGEVMWMETSITPIFDDQGALQLWIAVERDITEAKEREAELARARAAAEEAGKAKSQFLANMSHEIRTPMNGVIGVAELLAETDLSAQQRQYVETITESGRLLLDIINDILDLAKLQSGKATLDPRAFSLTAAVESVLRILAPVAAKKAIDLALDLPPDVIVLGDEVKLKQILLNLTGNAVKFTQKGGVTVSVRAPLAPGDLLEIVIADTGVGIARDRIDKIFDSFSQADNGISRQFGGTGLGLTICAMLAEQMGGGIAVQSNPGQGSVFTLRLMMPRTAELATLTPKTPAPPGLRAGLRVMVAEDNRTNMMIVRKMLQGQFTTLIEAANGEEAVKLFQELSPDLILMDVSMPVKDGLQATREIRAWEAANGLVRTPVVALTANAFGEDRLACMAAGLDGFLVKPLSRADLLAEIATHCPPNARPKLAKGL